MKQFTVGFLFCALVASIALNVVQYNGSLVNKQNLQVMVSAEIQQAVAEYRENHEIENAVIEKANK